MLFHKKKDAIMYYNNLSDKNNYKLFEEDIKENGSKRFYVENPKIIFNKITNLKKRHFYEFWTEKTKMVFSVDIDYYYEKLDISTDELLINIINIIRNGAKKYYNYNYNIEDIIVLESSNNKNKYSSHIIFRGLNFKNYLICKDFYNMLNNEYEIGKYNVDKSIYNLTCLRLFLNSKFNNNSILLEKELIIDGISTKINNNNLYDFFLETMITNTNNNDITINTINIKIQKINNIEIENKNIIDISNININEILNNLPSKYYNDYDLWIKIGIILNNYNLFDLWDNWSKKSIKYDEKIALSTWKSLSSYKYNLKIGSLIHIAKSEDIKNIYVKNINIETIIDSYPIKAIEINLNNFKQSQITILNIEKLNVNNFKSIINKKFLCIQSEKGTGKTSNLFKSLSLENKNINILFISSRRTFGYKLLGDLKQFDFELYSDITDYKINSKRIICQIDSLLRLNCDIYDIIIVDECESLSRYITSSHFIKNPKASIIISYFEMLIESTKQIIIMDADLSDRSINYYKKLITLKNDLDIHLLINNYKSFKDYKLICVYYARWLTEILTKINNNNKLVIAMASNEKAKDIYNYLQNKFNDKKILLIHKESSDNNKRSLGNVNLEWIKYDIVIYTPSVCMGISFDQEKYFDYIFGYGCHLSLGAQEWCQMIHRVRSPINKEIYISIDNYKEYNDIDDTVSYNEVEKMLCSDYYLTNYDLCNNIITKKIKRIKCLDEGIDEEYINNNFIENNNNDNNIIYTTTIEYPYKEDAIYDLYVRNCIEIIENKNNFSASFFGYVKYKEYNIEYIKDLSNIDKEILNKIKDMRNTRKEHEKEKIIDGILNADNLTKEEYIEKKKYKDKDEYISSKDYYDIQKYNFINCYYDNIIIDKESIEKFYNKDLMKWYYNLSIILNTETQTTEEKLEILRKKEKNKGIVSNCYNDFSSKNHYIYHYHALDIIKHLGYDINKLNNKKLIFQDEKDDDYNEMFLYDIEELFNELIKSKLELDIKFNLNINLNNNNYNANFKLKYINKIIKSQYGLTFKKNKNIYLLSDNDIWKDLLEKKIIPKNLSLSNYEINNDILLDDE